MLFQHDCDGLDATAVESPSEMLAKLRFVGVPDFEGPRRYGARNLDAGRVGWGVPETTVREALQGIARCRRVAQAREGA